MFPSLLFYSTEVARNSSKTHSGADKGVMNSAREARAPDFFLYYAFFDIHGRSPVYLSLSTAA